MTEMRKHSQAEKIILLVARACKMQKIWNQDSIHK